MVYVFAGIDVSAKKLQVSLQDSEFEIENTEQGHRKLLQRLRRHNDPVRVCLESTGVYGLDLACCLYQADGVEVMVINPRAAKHFSEALMRRSKTDPVDARILRKYLERMDFVPWCPPPQEALELRALARRCAAMTEMKTQEKNRLHAAQSTESLKILREDIESNIRHLDQRLLRLQALAMRLIDQHPKLQCAITRMTSVKGIALVSAIQIYAELCVLPPELTARQWVAHAGLDPRHFVSGTIKGTSRISKAGNRYLRAALYMPAHNAMIFEPRVKAFADQLITRGKKKMQAKVAVMRKLLHAIHGMLTHDTDFNGEMFYAKA